MKALSEWLFSELEPIFVGDRGALGSYIAKYVENNGVSDKPALVDELRDFLGDATVPFVDRMIQHVSGESSQKRHKHDEDEDVDILSHEIESGPAQQSTTTRTNAIFDDDEDEEDKNERQENEQEDEKEKEEEKAKQELMRGLHQQRVELQKKVRGEIASMKALLAKGAQGKKKEFLLEQVRALSEQLTPLEQTVAALEARAGELGIVRARVFRRNKEEDLEQRFVLDNRPKKLKICILEQQQEEGQEEVNDLPRDVPIKAVLGRFKTFGLIDEIDLESPSATITFATHDAAQTAKEKAKEMRVGTNTYKLHLEFLQN